MCRCSMPCDCGSPLETAIRLLADHMRRASVPDPDRLLHWEHLNTPEARMWLDRARQAVRDAA